MTILNFYKVEDRFYAGEYPFAVDNINAKNKLRVLDALRISHAIDLTENNELIPYSQHIPRVCHYRFSIQDRSIPGSIDKTKGLMNYMKTILDGGGVLYVHCRGGVGRTGVIIACWFAYNGLSPAESLEKLNLLWKECPKSVRRKHCPEYTWQEQFIYDFDKYLNNHDLQKM